MEKAFCYLRVSGDSQLDGDGFPRQSAAVKAYAKQHGYRLVRTFREEVVTGAKETMERPAWTAMITALHSNGVRVVLIEKLDRLARSLLVHEATLAELVKHGFTLVSVCQPDLMSDDPWRVAFRQMMGVFSELDKNQIVLKLRGARQRKRAQTGRCEGRKPYGHREGEQAVIARMRQLRSEGLAYHRIAERLNEAGIATRTRGIWRPQTVRSCSAVTRKPSDHCLCPTRHVQRPTCSSSTRSPRCAREGKAREKLKEMRDGTQKGLPLETPSAGTGQRAWFHALLEIKNEAEHDGPWG